ncbi:uncharacterized protein LOC115442445 isoform X2 [Manduca sexta]|uniref:uncharacterized protein LOC115442445 isoform X2 n=1 Tax=Manduca sexta TaxID=7130 RepID=UPI00188EB0C2|nr:uncharacterized protein LOC115442445 isoform X2 [Manduca sexta]
MLLKGNLLESLTIVSCSGTVICILLNCLTNISPITGVWFYIYLLTIFLVSVFLNFKFIQWLLRLNKPLKYDLEGLLAEYPHLSFLSRVLPDTKRSKKVPYKEYDTNELSVISTVLEKRLVSSWYISYISEEIGFPFACKQMLDQMIGGTFQICNKIETKDVYVDICTILSLHLKEYRKALKRHEKLKKQPIESCYNKVHITADPTKKISTADHCTNILRVIFKELVPWELWDTPHSELLIRILAKKLDNFISNTLVDPLWLNDKLMTLLKGEEVQPEEEPQSDFWEEVKPEVTCIETALSTFITKSTAPILQRGINEDVVGPSPEVKNLNMEAVEEVAVASEPVEIKLSPILRQRRGRQGRNEVKIYDRIIEGSVKTWETDMDLQCISLGQDLLASLDGELTLSRLWGQDGSPNPPRAASPQPLWFGEEDNIEIEMDTSPQKESKKEHSPKPADALLKDIQTTVSQAKNKIGDLQDEAAGMMEGLLDFGIAGLKKGLRFTGLSDDSQEKSPSHRTSEKSGDKTPPEQRNKAQSEAKDIPGPAVQREENGSGAPPLLKQQRVVSQDSVPWQSRSSSRAAAPAPTPAPSESPEPQYEEVADLSTSIARLRTLLQQRAHTNSARCEEVWWEGAEETRGRTQHHHSSRPVDTATLADEYDMNMERNSSPGQSSNNMQRLDKLFQRTVTGVFNSIKTAVGAEGEGRDGRDAREGREGQGRDDAPQHPHVHDWVYVCTSIEHSVGGSVARALGCRRAYSHVDAALDSLRQLRAPPAAPPHTPDDFGRYRHRTHSTLYRWAGRWRVRWAAGAPTRTWTPRSTRCASCARRPPRRRTRPTTSVGTDTGHTLHYTGGRVGGACAGLPARLLARGRRARLAAPAARAARRAAAHARRLRSVPTPDTLYTIQVGGSVARALGCRRAYSHVDAALDSLRQLRAPPAAPPHTPDDFGRYRHRTHSTLYRWAGRWRVRWAAGAPTRTWTPRSTRCASCARRPPRRRTRPTTSVGTDTGHTLHYTGGRVGGACAGLPARLLARGRRARLAAPAARAARRAAAHARRLRSVPTPDTLYTIQVGGSVARALGCRRAYSHVDAALDSLRQLRAPPAAPPHTPDDFGRYRHRTHSTLYRWAGRWRVRWAAGAPTRTWTPRSTRCASCARRPPRRRTRPTTSVGTDTGHTLHYTGGRVGGACAGLPARLLARGRRARLAAPAARAARRAAAHARRLRSVPTPDTLYTIQVGGSVARALGCRRAYSHVDAALDSLRQLRAPPAAPPHTPDDFDEWCSVSGPRWCALWALLSAAELGHSHVTHRIATLLFADLAESLISMWLDDFTAWLRKQVFVVFEQMSNQETTYAKPKPLRKMDLDETCKALMERATVLHVFGEEALSNSVKLVVSSFSHQQLNQDVALRLLDLLAHHFKDSAALRNPSFDTN